MDWLIMPEKNWEVIMRKLVRKLSSCSEHQLERKWQRRCLPRTEFADTYDVTTRVFRTEKMPKGNYNAITITVDNNTMRLREPNLRPVWAGQARLGRGRHQSDIDRPKRRDGRGARLPRHLSESDICLQPQAYCCRGYSSGRIGRGRGQDWGKGRGRRWQSSQSRFGFGMRRRAGR